MIFCHETAWLSDSIFKQTLFNISQQQLDMANGPSDSDFQFITYWKQEGERHEYNVERTKQKI